jgi:hypothetical protein
VVTLGFALDQVPSCEAPILNEFFLPYVFPQAFLTAGWAIYLFFFKKLSFYLSPNSPAAHLYT